MSETNFEAKTLLALYHSNIIKVLEYRIMGQGETLSGEQKDKLYMVMEYADLGTLSDVLRESSTMSEKIVRFFFKQLVEAVCFLHDKGYVHRDIKPSNILVRTEIEDIVLKLADFGHGGKISKFPGGKTDKIRGTVTYRPLEVYKPDDNTKG